MPQQPTYVNMYELANLAASKAREIIPSPPAEFNTPIAVNSTITVTPVTEKTINTAAPGEVEKDGSTSESSLESSSGYGSQTTFPVDDSAPVYGEGTPSKNLFQTQARTHYIKKRNHFCFAHLY